MHDNGTAQARKRMPRKATATRMGFQCSGPIHGRHGQVLSVSGSISVL